MISTHVCLRTELLFLVPLSNVVASSIVAQLLFLESEDPEKDINLYINSPGGSMQVGYL